MKRLNSILIIDNNDADNNSLKTIIEEMDITDTVLVAENGLEAMILLTKEDQIPPDLIFLGINMPKMNAWEFLEAYKYLEIRQKANIVIVMLTTSQNSDERTMAEKIKEVRGFETKPLKEENLRVLIAKYFSKEADLKNETEKLKILLVEDNLTDAKTLDAYFKEIYNDSYLLITCDNLKKALEALNSKTFDIIIMELDLPDSTGLKSFSSIFKTIPECPIIILTGLENESDGMKVVRQGAQDFLEKSRINSSSLKHAITHSLERYKLLRALAKNTSILHKQKSDLLKLSKQYENAQRMLHIGSWEWNRLSNTVSWSDEIYSIFGLRSSEFTPTLGCEVKYVHPRDREIADKILSPHYQDHKPFSQVFRIVCPDGTTKVVREEVTVTENEDSTIMNMFGTIQDITEQKRVEELLKEKEVADKLTIARDQFFSNMSHEIRTPLNGIIGFTKLLLKNGADKKQRKQLEAIKSSSDILLVLINDILELSKLDAVKLFIEETEMELEGIVKSIIESFELRFSKKQLKLDYKYDPNIPSVLMGDTIRIEQILLNIVNNAYKFTPNGGTIGIETKLIDENMEIARIEFNISDTGVGIPIEKLETIFIPFVQVNINSYEGTGLGLTVAKRLTDLMGGNISVKSKVNEGSTFTFTLPLRKTTVTKISRPLEIQLTPNEKKEIKSLKILLVEDSPINSLLMQMIFHQYGLMVDLADNGQIAIALLKKNDYDIILMDLLMPVMDGFEASNYIRMQMKPPKSGIPIIALTADVNKQIISQCKDAGINEYISKPFNENYLLKKIILLVKESNKTEALG